MIVIINVAIYDGVLPVVLLPGLHFLKDLEKAQNEFYSRKTHQAMFLCKKYASNMYTVIVS